MTEYKAVVGNSYNVSAKTEEDAKRQVRKLLLSASIPGREPWCVLYAFEPK